MANNKEPKYIIEGFKDDLESIAQQFSKNFPDARLVSFFKFWDDEHLDCLFANRFDTRELIEAILEMNSYLTQLLVSPGEDSLKLVALYMSLCIHIKQPEQFRRRLRWTCQDLVNIEAWCNCPNRRQALGLLKALKAFDLVEEHSIYGPSMIRRCANEDAGEQTKQTRPSPAVEERKETLEYLESRIEPTLSELRRIHANYDQFRLALELANYSEIGEPTATNTNPGVYLDQAANSLAQFKSSHLNQ